MLLDLLGGADAPDRRRRPRQRAKRPHARRPERSLVVVAYLTGARVEHCLRYTPRCGCGHVNRQLAEGVRQWLQHPHVLESESVGDAAVDALREHAVEVSVDGVNRDASPQSSHDGALDVGFAGKAPEAPEDDRVVGDHHVAARLDRLLDRGLDAVEGNEHARDHGVRLADQ